MKPRKLLPALLVSSVVMGFLVTEVSAPTPQYIYQGRVSLSTALLGVAGPAQVRVSIVGGTLYFDTTGPQAELHFGCLVIFRYGGDGSISTYCRGPIGPGMVLQDFKFWSKGLFFGSPATAAFTILVGPPFGAVMGRWSGFLVSVPF